MSSNRNKPKYQLNNRQKQLVALRKTLFEDHRKGDWAKLPHSRTIELIRLIDVRLDREEMAWLLNEHRREQEALDTKCIAKGCTVRYNVDANNPDSLCAAHRQATNMFKDINHGN